MNDQGKWNDPNPWHPITDPVDLKHLGKLVEELGELQSAIARTIIQGIDEREPVTGKLNRDWLCEELADVVANIELVCERFGISPISLQPRIDRKKKHLRQWHDQA